MDFCQGMEFSLLIYRQKNKKFTMWNLVCLLRLQCLIFCLLFSLAIPFLMFVKNVVQTVKVALYLMQLFTCNLSIRQCSEFIELYQKFSNFFDRKTVNHLLSENVAEHSLRSLSLMFIKGPFITLLWGEKDSDKEPNDG